MTEKLHPFEDPRRHCLRLEEWPEADRAAWEAALAPGDLLDGTMGAGHHWCSDTRDKYRKGYGRWLTFLVMTGRLDPDLSPAERVTPEPVQAYVQELREQVAPWTLWGRLAELLAVARAMAPGEDWSWLRRVVRRLETGLKPSKNKHSRLRPAPEIFAWAIRSLREIERDPPLRHAETGYRDALIVALLIMCPTMRLRNLAMIEIGVHLIRMTESYQLRFAASEMKARKPIDIPVPAELSAYLDHYINEVRPRLLAKAPADSPKTERLWITQYGTLLGERMLHTRISTVTRRAFRLPINPHLFRDCAATSVAIDDPAHIGIAAPVLGHTDMRTTEEHYIQAQQIEAGRRLQKSLRDLRALHPPRHARSKSRKDVS